VRRSSHRDARHRGEGGDRGEPARDEGLVVYLLWTGCWYGSTVKRSSPTPLLLREMLIERTGGAVLLDFDTGSD